MQLQKKILNSTLNISSSTPSPKDKVRVTTEYFTKHQSDQFTKMLHQTSKHFIANDSQVTGVDFSSQPHSPFQVTIENFYKA